MMDLMVQIRPNDQPPPRCIPQNLRIANAPPQVIRLNGSDELRLVPAKLNERPQQPVPILGFRVTGSDFRAGPRFSAKHVEQPLIRIRQMPKVVHEAQHILSRPPLLIPGGHANEPLDARLTYQNRKLSEAIGLVH